MRATTGTERTNESRGSGFSKQQWGPWSSHNQLFMNAVREMNWESQASVLQECFALNSNSKTRVMNESQYMDVFEPLKHLIQDKGEPYHRFFKVFDRKNEGAISETDFVSGIMAVSPQTPHRLGSSAGRLRLQFIFMMFDQDRTGLLSESDLRNFIDHVLAIKTKKENAECVNRTLQEIKQIAAQSGWTNSQMGFAQFLDAAQHRIISGTSQILRVGIDLAEVLATEGVAKVYDRSLRKSPQPLAQPSQVPRLRSASSFKDEEADLPPTPKNALVHGKPSIIYNNLTFSPERADQKLEESIIRMVQALSPNHDWGGTPLRLCGGDDFLALCDKVVEVLRREDSLVDVPLPCRVYGDIHGQLPDLLQFFNNFAWPDQRKGDILSMNYVFLGDFVDRGAYSLSVISLLFAFKLLHPKKVFLVRGNHEDRLMNQTYGFMEDCLQTFGHSLGKSAWEPCNDVFEFLPISALVGREVLCIHGGIGNYIESLSDLKGLLKPIIVTPQVTGNTTREEHVVLDALWSDPTDNDSILGVQESPRGQNTCRFGPDRVRDFNRRNNIKLIIRAHECVKAGYEYFAGGQLLTVFSATNYCNTYDNDGAMIVLHRDPDTNDVCEHAQVIKSGDLDTSTGWAVEQFRDPSPMRRHG